jgi:uncharacterized damage-inducible protein DinB
MSTMTEEQQRIRSYLTVQSAKLAPAAIIEKVQAAMSEVLAAAAAVPVARFATRPAPEEWSANQVMAHVLAADTFFSSAIVSVIEDRPLPERAERSVENAPQRTAGDWSEALERQRADLFARIAAADPAARLDRTIAHPFFGPLDWRATLLFLRLHDLDHAGQLRAIATAVA